MQIDKLQEYIDGLNAPQREAVMATEGPVLVIAGAGSGKTRVLTLRIAYLISEGVKPYNILALTFTNKAAKEMKERIAGIVGADLARQLWMGTFHSVFAKILRIEAGHIGISPDFTIYDTTDSKALIKSIMKDLGLANDKSYTPQAVLGSISSAKNDLILPSAYAADPKYVNADKAAGRHRTAEIYRIYVEECRKSNALDFDDLLLYTNMLFRDCPEVLDKYQQKFPYILVDEYQDTNMSQYSIINRLAKSKQNICVVGDDAQSIYSFRGARIENILNFQTDYPQCRLFKLEQNYRSTQNIVGAANKLIAHNLAQIPKNVFSRGDDGDKVKVWPCATDRLEARRVVADVALRMRAENKSPDDFAILYRTNAQSHVLEDEMRTAGIPYKIYGGTAFFQRAEVKDVLAYLRLAVNQNDTESLRRIINVPKRQIGDTTVDKIAAFARSHNMTMWDVMSYPRNLEQVGLNGPTQARISRFVAMMDILAQQSGTLGAYPFAVEVLSQSGLLQELSSKKDDQDGKDRFANVQELLNDIKYFADRIADEGDDSGSEDNIRGYLMQESLNTDIDEDDDNPKVSLMAIHSSKGLEFDSVYIVGVEDEIFPGSKGIADPSSIEEERRLMYVALTRAKRSCVVSYATERYKFGKTEVCHPSRFVAELDPQYCDKPVESGCRESGPAGGFRYGVRTAGASRVGGGGYGRQPAGGPFAHSSAVGRRGAVPAGQTLPSNFRRIGVRPADAEPERKLAETPDGLYRVGARVEHDRFGTGTVVGITCSNMNDVKLRIAFDKSNEEKTLLLKFARIKRL